VMVLLPLWAISTTRIRRAVTNVAAARSNLTDNIAFSPATTRSAERRARTTTSRNWIGERSEGQPIDVRGEKLEGKNRMERGNLTSHLAIDGPVHMHRHPVDAAQGRQPTQ
jgi:hypothetical protein